VERSKKEIRHPQKNRQRRRQQHGQRQHRGRAVQLL